MRFRLDATTVLTDPVLGRWVGPLRREGPAPGGTAATGTDLVLLSHAHHDHLDLASLRLLPPTVLVVLPRGLAPLARAAGIHRIIELDAGQVLRLAELTVTAVPAEHSGTRWGSSLHAPALGYLLHGSRTVYIAGDTSRVPARADLDRPVDLALVPTGGWGPRLGPGHLNAQQAAQACARLEPRVAVPVHWGTFAVPPTRLLLPAACWAHQSGAAFARHLAQLAPHCRPVVLRPGQSTVLTSQHPPGDATDPGPCAPQAGSG